MATKTTSVRAEDETIEKFDRLAAESKLSKTELYALAVDAAEEKLLKEKIPGRKDEIDAVESALKQIKKIYFTRIELAIMAKNTAEKELKIELDTKTRTIADLQAAQDDLKKQIEDLKNDLSNATVENNKLQVESMKMKEAMAEKDALIESLNQSLKNNTAAIEAIEEIKELRKLIKEKQQS